MGRERRCGAPAGPRKEVRELEGEDHDWCSVAATPQGGSARIGLQGAVWGSAPAMGAMATGGQPTVAMEPVSPRAFKSEEI